MALYKQKKKQEPIDQEAFADFCVELGIWARTPNGGIVVKYGPIQYTTEEIKRLFKERQKKESKR
jgi:hypothetical protein